MVPDYSTADAASGARPTPAPRLNPLPPRRADASDETMARINRLVTAIKAERGAEGAVHQAAETGERGQLVTLLRRFLAARERERLAWEEAMSRLEAELAETKAAARAVQEQAAGGHQRALADLELLHEHQRSIWSLERRRLEVTVVALERTLRAQGARSKARLVFAASLLVVAVLGLGVATDSDPGATAGRLLERFDSVRQLPLPELLHQGRSLTTR
ncbi:MAG TPA: hypothetical protein VF502_01470 [Stellaceae bacterium]